MVNASKSNKRKCSDEHEGKSMYSKLKNNDLRFVIDLGVHNLL
jgi:hypothetical protein